jgi:hypothetical protein
MTYVPSRTWTSLKGPQHLVIIDDWRQQLLTAAEEVGANESCVMRFDRALALAGASLESGVAAVEHHVLAALQSYVTRSRSRPTSDPW